MASNKNIRFLQLNLHHAKAATSVLNRSFSRNLTDIGLIQEPWADKGLIKGLPNNTCKLIYSQMHDLPRAALLISKQLKFVSVPEFITRDLATAEVELPTERGKRQIIIASAYFPGDEDQPPSEEVKGLISWCNKKNRQLILGCDANSHNIVWGSTDTNKRGEYLLEYLANSNIDIINRGNKPTFITANRKEVLDITLTSCSATNLIQNWHVSDEVSMSDHRTIRFEVEAEREQIQSCRIPKQTDWCAYKDTLRSDVEGVTYSIETIEELEGASQWLNRTIISCYEGACPIKTKAVKKDVPWWNRELSKLKAQARKAFNRAKSIGNWDAYKKALTEYNKELRRSKRRTWRQFCEGITELAPAVRLQKVISKDHSNGIGLLKKPNGEFTATIEESMSCLLQSHFPGSTLIEDDPRVNLDESNYRTSRAAKSLAGKIFTKNRIKWAINSFKPYKSPGEDGVFPALLQQGVDTLTPHLVKLFKMSFILGYIPKGWREVRVCFIPKSGKRPPEEPKSYRPISLTSFLLKSMEKILDTYIRSEYLTNIPLHKEQFAYQLGKSTVDALHCLVKDIEKAIGSKEVALCAFIDIEGAFDNTSYESISAAATAKGIQPSITKWIQSMLNTRKIITYLGGKSTTIKAVKGCPQGGVLSPLLWSLVVDDLLTKLKRAGFRALGYADDLVIVARGKHDGIIAERMQQALNIITTWCSREGLSVNPNKTTLIPFTNRRKLTLQPPIMNGVTLSFSEEVKYLGVILDRKLTWNAHLTHITTKAIRAFWMCRRLFGKTWGLKPKMIYWSYLTVVRPIITYAAMVWWTKTKQQKAINELQKVQRLACIGITGAMRSCPTAALEAMLDLPPLHLHVQRIALENAYRLTQTKSLKPGDLTGHLEVLRAVTTQIMKMPTDVMPAKQDFELALDVIINDRELTENEIAQITKGALTYYTDGSKTNEGVGIGITGPNIRISAALGNAPTIFQAELLAIEFCAQECLRKGLNTARIFIASDSQAALKALKSTTYESKIAWNCKQSLKQLASRNKLKLLWVPGHKGIVGNEIADSLAKEGACAPFIGPEPFCGISKSRIMEEVRKYEKELSAAYWKNVPGQRQAKRLLRPSARYAKLLLELQKSDLRVITGILTGHCSLRYHLCKMGILDSGTCRFCDEADETSEHIICNCRVIVRQRHKYLEQVFLDPDQITNLAPKRIMDFLRSLDLLD